LTLWRRIILATVAHGLTVVLLLKKSRTDRVWIRLKQGHQPIAVQNQQQLCRELFSRMSRVRLRQIGSRHPNWTRQD
jgi:hypothetical protein